MAVSGSIMTAEGINRHLDKLIPELVKIYGEVARFKYTMDEKFTNSPLVLFMTSNGNVGLIYADSHIVLRLRIMRYEGCMGTWNIATPIRQNIGAIKCIVDDADKSLLGTQKWYCIDDYIRSAELIPKVLREEVEFYEADD